MATTKKRKTKHAAPAAEKPRKRRKRKAARKPRKRRATSHSAGSAPKRARKPLQLVLRVEDTAINSPALAKLSDGQRVDLAAMNSAKSFSTRPAWALDEKKWRSSIRLVSPQWKRLRNPWATVARVYLLQDGPIGHGRGHVERDREPDREQPAKQRAQASRSTSSGGPSAYGRESPLTVERLHVDETGVDTGGTFRGRGTWWRVSSRTDSIVVRASTPAEARSEAAPYL